MKSGEKIVIALGGNSLIKKGQKPTISNQFKNTQKTLEKIVPLIKKNKIVITHGNGFQVGNILIRVEKSLGKAYSIPLEVCVAESQGEIPKAN
jgi:carbamate kinase